MNIADLIESCRRALRMFEWTFTFSECTPEEMPMAGALAVCSPTPTRKTAHISIVKPWPAEESLAVTLMHEASHAKISPLTALIAPSAAATMIEEGIVEDLGIAFAAMTPEMAQSAARALETYAPRLLARISAAAGVTRISALAQRARSGGTAMMNPETVKKLIDAIEAGDAAAMAEVGKQLLIEAASGGAPAIEPDGDEGARALGEDEMDTKAQPAAGASPAPATQAEPPARATARIAQIDKEHLRARRTADKSTGLYIRGRLAELRREGVKLDTAFEAQLAKMTDDEAFDCRIGDLLRGRAMGSPSTQRGRTDVPGGHRGAPPPSEAGPALVDADTLRKEGADESWIRIYHSTAQHDPKAGEAMLAGFRDPTAARARARHGVGGGFGRGERVN